MGKSLNKLRVTTLLLFLLSGIVPSMAFIVGFIGIYTSPKKWRIYIYFIIYTIFVGAYTYVPTPNADLEAYLSMINWYKNLSLVESLGVRHDFTYGVDILFWFCSNFNIPHFAPAFTTAVIYYIAIYITFDTAERYKYTKYVGRILLAQLLAIPYIAVINNIRNVFGLSLICFATYRDIVQKKIDVWTLIFYVFGIVMHLFCVIAILFRLISPLFKNKKFLRLLFVFPIFFPSVLIFVYNKAIGFSFGGALGTSLKRLLDGMYGAVSSGNSYYGAIASSSGIFIMQRLIMMFSCAIILILAYLLIRKHGGMICASEKTMIAYVGMIASITLACNAFAVPSYWRFAAACFVCSGAIFIPVMAIYKDSKSWIKAVAIIALILGTLEQPLNLWQNRLQNYVEWGINILLTNYVSIIVNL